jgi:hypothetical protein
VRDDPDSVRVWRGFRAPSIDLPAFYQRLGTVFVPATVLMQIDAGLEAYVPTVLGGLTDKPDTAPDETAILFWESQDAYRDGFETLAVRTYTLTHGAVYTAASGAEFPQPFAGTLAPDQPYNLVDRVADWMHGTVRHLVGARPQEVDPASFRAGLAAVLAGVAALPPGAIACAGDDYVTYWQLEADSPPDPDPLAGLAALSAWSHTSAAQPTSLEIGLWEQWPGLTIVPGQSLNMQFRRRWEDR